MTKVDDELRRLDHEIEALLEANRQDWLTLFEKTVSKEKRLQLRKDIAARDQELFHRLEWKWEMKDQDL